MRVETVQPNGPASWVVGLVGIQSERFRKMTLSVDEINRLTILDADAKRQPYDLSMNWKILQARWQARISTGSLTSIADDALQGLYKRGEYRDVILLRPERRAPILCFDRPLPAQQSPSKRRCRRVRKTERNGGHRGGH